MKNRIFHITLIAMALSLLVVGCKNNRNPYYNNNAGYNTPYNNPYGRNHDGNPYNNTPGYNRRPTHRPNPYYRQHSYYSGMSRYYQMCQIMNLLGTNRGRSYNFGLDIQTPTFGLDTSFEWNRASNNYFGCWIDNVYSKQSSIDIDFNLDLRGKYKGCHEAGGSRRDPSCDFSAYSIPYVRECDAYPYVVQNYGYDPEQLLYYGPMHIYAYPPSGYVYVSSYQTSMVVFLSVASEEAALGNGPRAMAALDSALSYQPSFTCSLENSEQIGTKIAQAKASINGGQVQAAHQPIAEAMSLVSTCNVAAEATAAQ